MNPLDLIPPTSLEANAAKLATLNAGMKGRGQPTPEPLRSKFGGVPVPVAAAPIAVPQSKFGGVAVQEPAAPPAPQHYTVAGIPIPDQIGAPLEQVAAGLNRSIYSIAGLPEWAVRSAINLPKAVQNVTQGKPVTEGMIQPGMFSSESIAKTLQNVGITDPSNVKAKTLSDKLLQAFGEGAGAMAAPEMFFPKLIAAFEGSGIVGEQAAQIAKAMLGEGSSVPQVVKDAIIAGAANAMGQGAAEAVPDQWKPLVHTLGALGGAIGVAGVAEAVPAMVKAGSKAAADIVAPLSAAGRERLAGEQLTAAATDAEAAKSAIRNYEPAVEGSQQTTGAVTGDMGLLAKERTVATQAPEVFNQLRADQNAARVGAVTDTQAAGSGEAVIAALRSHLNEIDNRTAAEVAAATRAADTSTQGAAERARTATETIGQGTSPDVAGDAIRQRYEAARADAKTAERNLWNAVDPNGTLQLDAAQTKSEVSRIFKEIPTTAKPPADEEAAIYAVAQTLPDTVPLSDLTALQSRVKAALRQERMANGESPAYRRLSQINQALQNNLETAVAEKAVQEQKAVDAGQMSAHDTIASRIKAYADNHLAQTDAGPMAAGGNLAAAVPGQAAPVAVGAGGTNGPAVSGPASGGSNPAISPGTLQSNLDAAALGRLREARAATKQRVETFDNRTLSPIRRRPGTTAPYDMPASAVPQRIFFPRPASKDAVATYVKAVGQSDALATLEPYAIDRLRRVALRDDGTLDPVKTETWLRNHADAMSAFPELEAKVRAAAESSKALKAAEAAAKETVAAAEKQAKIAKDEAQSGAIGKIVGAADHEEVVRRVGSVFGRPDAAREMAALRRATKGDAAAQAGLRKAVVDWVTKKFVSNTEVGTSDVGALKSDQFQTFIREHSNTLKAAGFTEQEVGLWKRVADDLRTANRSIVAVKLPGGSNTSQDLWSVVRDHRRDLFHLLALPLGTGLVESGVHGQVWGISSAVVAGMFTAARARGISKVNDLVREALLDPDLALKLMERIRPKVAPRQARSLIEALAPSSIVGALSGKGR